VKPIEVGILGATGTVGEELMRRLHAHPWFRVTEVGASDSSVGGDFQGLTLRSMDGDWDAPLLFSALPAGVARELEPELARRGHAVVSNASAHRMAPAVPLLIPEINADHLALLDAQPWSGLLVTNPNCAVAALAPALAPLEHAFGIDAVVATSLQAISGAGRPGPSAGDLLDNVIPWIGGEEEKVETEPQRILGRLDDGRVRPAAFGITATCTRVPVHHGHTVSATVRLSSPGTADDVFSALESEPGLVARPDLPTSPETVLHIFRENDGPQPRLDRDRGDGMTISVGRVRVRGNTVSLLAMTHNLGRGAAGAALQNAELLRAEGHLDG